MPATLTLVANDWTQLSNTDKANLLTAAEEELPTGAELETLGAFRIVTTYPYAPLTLSAVPTDKLILPKTMFGTNFENIDTVTITQTVSGNGKTRYVVTNDLSTYYTWDAVAGAFVPLQTVTAASVLADGMTAAAMASLNTAAWGTIFDNTYGIGIGFALSINLTDTAEIDNMQMQVDMRGKWKRAVHGTDYDYAYTSNTQLVVSLAANGTYKINYPSGVSV